MTGIMAPQGKARKVYEEEPEEDDDFEDEDDDEEEMEGEEGEDEVVHPWKQQHFSWQHRNMYHVTSEFSQSHAHTMRMQIADSRGRD